MEIYQRLQVETGWPEDAMGKRYAQVTEYRLPLEEDLDNETYVDIVNRQGQPYIRNVGILRWGRKHSLPSCGWRGENGLLLVVLK